MIDFTSGGIHFWEDLRLWDKKLRIHHLNWYNHSYSLGGSMKITQEMIEMAKYDWKACLAGNALRACENCEQAPE